MLRLVLAWLHLLALGIGLGAIIDRALAFREPMTHDSIRRGLRADTLWGVAAVVWLTTGLWRAIAGTEKNTSYYLNNHLFWGKMGLFLVVLALELWPMVTLIRWRVASVKNGPADPASLAGAGRRIATISILEAAIVAAMVLVAVAMARGYGVGR